jgi:hypothetical protein
MKYVLYILLTLVALACTRKPKYDDTPEISFNEYLTKAYFNLPDPNSSLNKDSIIFAIDFKDGDGDLGLNEEQRADTSRINFIMREYKLVNGSWTPHIPDGATEPTVYKEQFQLLSPIELNGPIDGTIYNTKNFFYAYYLPNDTIKFTIEIIDRAGHSSNVVESPYYIIYKQ